MAVLDDDEDDCDDDDRSEKYVEQKFREPDSHELPTELFGQEPIDRTHEPHQQPNDHRVDVENLGDIEMEDAEKKVGVDIVVG